MIPLLIALLSCASAPEPGPTALRPDLPEQAVEIALVGERLLVDGEPVDHTQMDRDLTDGIYGPLLDSLADKPGTAAWIHAPGDTPWMFVRKLMATADEAGRSERWVAAEGRAYGPSQPPKARYRPSCPEGGLPVDGISRRLSVEIFHGTDGTWVEASVHFAARSEGVAAIGAPASCWTGASCDLAGDQGESCTHARGTEAAPGRVAVAGAIGCILPLSKAPGDEARWPEELAANLKGLGIGSEDEATLVIEANAPWAAVIAVMEGFRLAELPPPALGLPLVEGHGSPPLCTATVRDATTLGTAGAKWLGSRLSAEEPAAAQEEGG